MPRDLYYLGVIVFLVIFIAAMLEHGFKPRDCSKAAEASYTIGYTKGIKETLEMGS